MNENGNGIRIVAWILCAPFRLLDWLFPVKEEENTDEYLGDSWQK